MGVRNHQWWTNTRTIFFGLMTLLLGVLEIPAIQITEVMYHPPVNEAQNEWVEIYNETSARRDLSNWRFDEGIDYVFPAGTVLEPGAYLVIAADPATITGNYGISNVVGPFTGRLNNSSDHVILHDPANGIMAEVDYEDQGRWPVSADGAGHSLAKFVIRGDPMDPDNWRQSNELGGTPGLPNGFAPWTQDTEIISIGDTWKYFKGVSEATTPADAWRDRLYDDSGAQWLSGATGIGYGDGDDQTTLFDMSGNYWSIYCRKTFTLSDPSTIDQLILEVDHDDGFIAYLNNQEVGRPFISVAAPTAVTYNTPANNHEAGTPTVLDISAYKSALVSGTNVLCVQVHNATLGSSDLSFIPRLISRTTHQPGQSSVPVLLNEMKFYTSGTQYIELYNRSGSSFDVGGHYLSNDPDNLGLFQIPSPTVIPANGHVSFDDTTLGFRMLSTNDRILLTSPGLDVVVDARAVEAATKEMTEGRWPDGGDLWYYMDATTGTANSVTLSTDIVINEIMYHPVSELSIDEYVEIYNRGAAPVNMAGWRFTRGINYDFPSTVTINPGQYLVVAKDRLNLISKYSLSPAVVLGNYTGNLSDAGEKVRLRDANNNIADEVRYYDGGHWSRYADGDGSSLELIDPDQDNGNYQAWAPSDEASKAQWTQFTYSGTATTQGDTNLHEFHIHLLSPGEVLVDDIRVYRGPTDYFTNGGFESGIGNWVLLGNHQRSQVTMADAHGGSRALHIIATGGGDTGANHIEQDASISMPSGQPYMITFWAKWLWGPNLVVTRLYGNEAPETHRLPIPALNGTPGAQNSVYQANLGPVFSEVAYSPVVPGPADTVTVTSRIDDPDGVGAVTLYHRADADGAYASVPMVDNGTGGDAVSGDGIFTGQIPARPIGQTVAFYMQATDGAASANTWPNDTSEPALYRVDNPFVSSFPTYRVVMRAVDENRLYNGLHKSNEPIHCTFIYDETDVYHECGIRFTGSPYGRRGNGYRGFKVAFNNDEKLHGTKWQARFDSGQNGGYRDRLSYDLLRSMGQPTCPLEWVACRVNGRNEGVREDTTPPGRLYIDTYFAGDDEGQLLEIALYYGYTDADDTNPQNFWRGETTFRDWGNDKDDYRWNYRLRNNKRADDYTSTILAIRALNEPDATYEQEVEKYIDMIQWMRTMSVRSVINDWDFYGTDEPKNAFWYWHPTEKHFKLLPWDCELAYGTGRGFGQGVYCYGANQSAIIRRFQQFRGYRHHFLNAVHEFMAKYFTRAHMDPWIDYYYGLVGGVNAGSVKSFIDQQRPLMQAELDPYLPPNPNALMNITTADPLTVPALTATLQGTAPVNCSWIRVGGVYYWPYWSSANNWEVTVSVPGGSNTITLEFLDYDKQLLGSDTIQINAPAASTVDGWKKY